MPTYILLFQQVHINGVETHTHESFYEGSIFNDVALEATGVTTVTLESIGLLPDEWISLIEVCCVIASAVPFLCRHCSGVCSVCSELCTLLILLASCRSERLRGFSATQACFVCLHGLSRTLLLRAGSHLRYSLTCWYFDPAGTQARDQDDKTGRLVATMALRRRLSVRAPWLLRPLLRWIILSFCSLSVGTG